MDLKGVRLSLVSCWSSSAMFPVNLGPFALLLVTQVIMPKAGFIG